MLKNTDAITLSKSQFDINEFKETIQIIHDMFYLGKIKGAQSISPELKEKILKMETEIAILSSIQSVKKYINIAKPKNIKLFEINLKLNDHLEFKVLKDLSFKHFTIGAETNCCQRIGGEGEEAAVDSFINPLAGVLALYYDDKIISQSYFHYVPKDNGIVLDNVEKNPSNVRYFKVNLDNCYASLANEMKRKLNISYFRCGLNWNRLSENKFEISKLSDTDPRYFEVDDIYTDFDELRNLDLLRPKFKLNNNWHDMSDGSSSPNPASAQRLMKDPLTWNLKNLKLSNFDNFNLIINSYLDRINNLK